jgi:hypothetical protein
MGMMNVKQITQVRVHVFGKRVSYLRGRYSILAMRSP